ncbi:MAG TPA: hypothetical protein HPQ04_00630 [Rhodospirillaceae bacterium]|nr:hypothetical protein [Rhodospirillaceae bacterium]
MHMNNDHFGGLDLGPAGDVGRGQPGGFDFGLPGAGCLGGAGGSNATYSFGTPTGTAVGSTLTETITSGTRTTTIVYTETQAATATTPALFQITAPTLPTHDGTSSSTSITPPTYSFVTGSSGVVVTENITTASATETLTYAGGTQLTETLVTITSPSATTANGGTHTYSFTTGTSGTTVTENDSYGSVSSSHTEPVNPTAVFAATTIGTTAAETQTSVSGNAIQKITYINTSGSNYVVSSTDTVYIPQGSATTALNINPNDRAEFSITSSGTTITPVNASGTTLTSFTASSSNTFAVVTPTSVPAGLPAAGSFVEETITNGTHTNSVLFYSATGSSGIYTEVAHGTTIDVTGVANQLAQVPSSILGLL